MSQLTLYLEEEIAEQVKNFAAAAGLSQSKWVAQLITVKTSMEWPREVVELAGAWKDFSDLEPIRSGSVDDLPRESM